MLAGTSRSAGQWSRRMGASVSLREPCKAARVCSRPVLSSSPAQELTSPRVSTAPLPGKELLQVLRCTTGTAKTPHQRGFTCVTAGHTPNSFCETFKHSQLWQIVSNFLQCKAGCCSCTSVLPRVSKSSSCPLQWRHSYLIKIFLYCEKCLSVGFWWRELPLFFLPTHF